MAPLSTAPAAATLCRARSRRLSRSPDRATPMIGTSKPSSRISPRRAGKICLKARSPVAPKKTNASDRSATTQRPPHAREEQRVAALIATGAEPSGTWTPFDATGIRRSTQIGRPGPAVRRVAASASRGPAECRLSGMPAGGPSVVLLVGSERGPYGPLRRSVSARHAAGYCGYHDIRSGPGSDVSRDPWTPGRGPPRRPPPRCRGARTSLGRGRVHDDGSRVQRRQCTDRPLDNGLGEGPALDEHEGDDGGARHRDRVDDGLCRHEVRLDVVPDQRLSLIHISEPTRPY